MASSALLDPAGLIGSFGTWALAGVLIVVFVEAGVIFPVLPGDTLLFVAGMIAAGTRAAELHGASGIDFHIWQLLTLIPLAAFLGGQTGYLIGRFVGTAMFKPQARVLKQRYLDEAHAFFERRGASAIVLTRFLPIIRTLVPISAGAARMNSATFAAYNLVGAVAWGAGVPLLGYGLGQFDVVQRLLEPIFIVVGLASVAPMVIEWWKRRRARKRSSGAPVVDAADACDRG